MDQAFVYEKLREVQDPLTGQLLISSGRLQIVWGETGDLFLSISIEPSQEKLFQPIQRLCHNLLQCEIKGKVRVTLTAHQRQPSVTASSSKTNSKPQPSVWHLPTIKKIIAITSGKGGVGKSTVALNLAVAAAQIGLRTALVDADIYGPSLPLLINHWEKPTLNDNHQMIPHEAYGIKMQSLGFLLPRHQPVIWRGPMAASSFQNLIKDTAWGDIDLMFIDLPPGTGDIHLTLCQKIPLNGTVIVTTPQDLALIDALKAVKMFETLKIPILGLIENMSLLICPACAHTIDIFGQGQGQASAHRQNLTFLGEVPLDLDLRKACDTGIPLGISDPQHPISRLFQSLIKAL